jgi:uncharacterized protein YbjQ (UPF0145 family)
MLAVLKNYAKLGQNLLEIPMTIAAATESGRLLGALPLFAIFLSGAAIFRWIRKSKSMTEPNLDKLERELDLIKNQILLVTTDDLPGIRIAKTLGYIEALSPTEAASDWEYRLAEKDALLKLAQKARDIGANAVVGIRKTNAHYDQAGSQWRVSRVTYCGTAVIREN